jgi:hypothetical protein
MDVEIIESEKGALELFINNKGIGHYILDVDGYYYFWFNHDLTRGSWSSYALRIISDQMDSLNKEHDDRVRKYFENESDNSGI